MHKSSSRKYLNVPYAEKDAAKQLGARWDAEAKKWYIPPGIESEAFAQWLPDERQPSPLPVKKSQSTEPLLTIELVPKTCWYSNVRSEVSPEEWNVLRKRTYQQANHCCEVCGGKGAQHAVECHEVWHYDDKELVQTLIRLIALCPACHECKHMGFANVQGRGKIAAAHLARVNGWTEVQANTYINQCFQIWKKRSQVEWQLDISYLNRI